MSHPEPTGSLRAWLWGEQGVVGEYLLARRSVRIGRDPASDIVLADATVSRQHATLDYRDGGWWLLPEVTGHGTRVNGRVVQAGEQVPVRDEDRLRFGLHTQLRLRVPPGRAA
ncbi:MAG TPA: FHA domain-containing protein [Streptosporangiaceae bacterium]|nr:FHA domain-containing protein [Streptosporangiaceae bacterium]